VVNKSPLFERASGCEMLWLLDQRETSEVATPTMLYAEQGEKGASQHLTSECILSITIIQGNTFSLLQ